MLIISIGSIDALLWMTWPHRHPHDVTDLSHKSGVMLFHSSLNLFHNSVVVDVFFAMTSLRWSDIDFRLDLSLDSGLAISISQFLHFRETTRHFRQCDMGHYLSYNLLVDWEMFVMGERHAVEGCSGTYEGPYSICREHASTHNASSSEFKTRDTLKEFSPCSLSYILVTIWTNRIKSALVTKMVFGPVLIRPHNMIFSKEIRTDSTTLKNSLDLVWLGYAMLCYARLGYAMLCYARLCYAMLG